MKRAENTKTRAPPTTTTRAVINRARPTETSATPKSKMAGNAAVTFPPTASAVHARNREAANQLLSDLSDCSHAMESAMPPAASRSPLIVVAKPMAAGENATRPAKANAHRHGAPTTRASHAHAR